jgi:hypothetical protein
MWRPQELAFTFRNINKTAYAFYSRRSDPKGADSYKSVKVRKCVDGNDESININYVGLQHFLVIISTYYPSHFACVNTFIIIHTCLLQ